MSDQSRYPRPGEGLDALPSPDWNPPRAYEVGYIVGFRAGYAAGRDDEAGLRSWRIGERYQHPRRWDLTPVSFLLGCPRTINALLDAGLHTCGRAWDALAAGTLAGLPGMGERLAEEVRGALVAFRAAVADPANEIPGIKLRSLREIEETEEPARSRKAGRGASKGGPA